MAGFPGGTGDGGGDGKAEYEVDIPKISEYIGKLTACIVSVHEKIEGLQSTIKGMEKRISRFESQGRAMNPEEKKQILDDIVIFNMAIKAGERIMTRPAYVLSKLKSILG
jgi:uncharacterized coiled-coil DUF342 family protein